MSLEGHANASAVLRGKIRDLHVPAIDKTLTKENQAAEAKATGEAIATAEKATQDALNAHKNTRNPHGTTAADVGARPNTWMPTATDVGAAPAGFGLGEGSVVITDCNTAVLNGFYRWESGCANAPFSYGVMQTIARAKNTHCVQIAYRHGGGQTLIAVRKSINNLADFEPWEYLNPPMAHRKEYRTVKRHNNKPVYVCNLIDETTSLPPANTRHAMAWGAIPLMYDDITVLSIEAVAHNPTTKEIQTFPIISSQDGKVQAMLNYGRYDDGSLLIAYKSFDTDMSAWKFTKCVLKYTKNTE